MLSESKVTIATARFLGHRGWFVKSMALPNGGSGAVFSSPDIDLPVVIPDIIAVNNDLGMAIAVESKPLFSQDDVRKLLSLKSGQYDESIYIVAGVQSQNLVACIAFSGAPNSVLANLGIDLAINVHDDGKAEVVFDGLKLFDGKN
jgi:hypothetical protein